MQHEQCEPQTHTESCGHAKRGVRLLAVAAVVVVAAAAAVVGVVVVATFLLL